MSEQLKPCPFCGSEKVELYRDGKGDYFINCKNCMCLVSGFYRTKRESLQVWNTRAEDKS
ncbi:MAG: Lar family restriction alleviation protein [Synergistaceae bacterium]|nr:Lar family restriction alleviation protein [Synergistaceae bacterium]